MSPLTYVFTLLDCLLSLALHPGEKKQQRTLLVINSWCMKMSKVRPGYDGFYFSLLLGAWNVRALYT